MSKNIKGNDKAIVNTVVVKGFNQFIVIKDKCNIMIAEAAYVKYTNLIKLLVNTGFITLDKAKKFSDIIKSCNITYVKNDKAKNTDDNGLF